MFCFVFTPNLILCKNQPVKEILKQDFKRQNIPVEQLFTFLPAKEKAQEIPQAHVRTLRYINYEAEALPQSETARLLGMHHLLSLPNKDLKLGPYEGFGALTHHITQNPSVYSKHEEFFQRMRKYETSFTSELSQTTRERFTKYLYLIQSAWNLFFEAAGIPGSIIFFTVSTYVSLAPFVPDWFKTIKIKKGHEKRFPNFFENRDPNEPFTWQEFWDEAKTIEPDGKTTFSIDPYQALLSLFDLDLNSPLLATSLGTSVLVSAVPDLIKLKESFQDILRKMKKVVATHSPFLDFLGASKELGSSLRKTCQEGFCQKNPIFHSLQNPSRPIRKAFRLDSQIKETWNPLIRFMIIQDFLRLVQDHLEEFQSWWRYLGELDRIFSYSQAIQKTQANPHSPQWSLVKPHENGNQFFLPNLWFPGVPSSEAVTNTFETSAKKSAILAYGGNGTGKTTLFQAITLASLWSNKGLAPVSPGALIPKVENWYTFQEPGSASTQIGRESLFQAQARLFAETYATINENTQNFFVLDEILSGTDGQASRYLLTEALRSLLEKDPHSTLLGITHHATWVLPPEESQIIFFEPLKKTSLGRPYKTFRLDRGFYPSHFDQIQATPSDHTNLVFTALYTLSKNTNLPVLEEIAKKAKASWEKDLEQKRGAL